MKFMFTWKISPGLHKPAAEIFLKKGAPMPPGLKLLGRWHAAGSAHGWLLVETGSSTAIAQHAAEWANYLELTVTPVIEDEETAGILSTVYSK